MNFGIIGGAGVAATNKLLELIENEITLVRGGVRDAHHPQMLICQATQAPSRSMYLEGRGESFIDDYISIALKMQNFGVDKILMCCNTAHYAIEQIQRKIDIEIVNLIKLVLERVVSYKKIGLIASDGCLKGRVYENIASQMSLYGDFIYPNESYQKLVTQGICNIKNKNRISLNNNNPAIIFDNVVKHLQDSGADIVVMGCTDIRVCYYNESVVDSLEELKSYILANHKLL